MFYAHEGSRNDNAFPLDYGNAPVRVFRAFYTKKERDAYREKVWADGENNLIDCLRIFVQGYLGRDFTTHRTGKGDSYICAKAGDDHYYQIPEAEFNG